MTANQIQTVPVARRRTVILRVVQIALAAFFIMAAMPKLMGDPTAVKMFGDIGFGQWFRYLTGSCELAGAIGLLVPRLSGVAALGLAGVMVGATITNFALPGMAAASVATVLLGVVFVLIARARWTQTRALVRMIRR
jgi:uncharacterized membrane protein YphA (DoxX/SURF4 family)